MAVKTDFDEVAFWRAYKEEQRARRWARLPAQQDEIRALARNGFAVIEVTPYQFRVAGRLDLYPTHRRFHDTVTGERGNYTRRALKELVARISGEPEHGNGG